MTRCAKSGWPVTGQSDVNSGAVKRARKSSPSCGFGTVSSIAFSGDAATSTARPSCRKDGRADPFGATSRLPTRFAAAFFVSSAAIGDAPDRKEVAVVSATPIDVKRGEILGHGRRSNRWTRPPPLPISRPPAGGAPIGPRAQVAQLVEQRIENPRVGGSIPPLGTIQRLTPHFLQPASGDRRSAAQPMQGDRMLAQTTASVPSPISSTNDDVATWWAPWWAVTGSNRRPTGCKPDALPTELTARHCASRANECARHGN